MCKSLRFFAFLFFCFQISLVWGQVEVLETLSPDKELRLYKQRSFFGQIHSNGFGAGYRFGNIKTLTRYNFQEIEFLKDKHPKAQKFFIQGRTNNLYRRFIFGGLNQLYVLRYGFGTHRILNEKPYWGGLEVGYTYSAGVTVGFAIPQFVRIFDTTSADNIKVVRYDPDDPAQNPNEIEGGGPLFKGLGHMKLYPGLYAKAGFVFDFGKYQEAVRSVEAGLMIDVFPYPVPMMAHNPKSYYFLNFYLSVHFGRRYNK